MVSTRTKQYEESEGGVKHAEGTARKRTTSARDSKEEYAATETPSHGKARKQEKTAKPSAVAKSGPQQKAAASGDNKNGIISRLISTYGTLPHIKVRVTANPKERSSQTTLALILYAMMSSARISHQIAQTTLQEVVNAKYHDINVLRSSTWDQRCDVLTKGGYTHYREKISTALGQLAELITDKYESDASKILEAQESSSQEIQDVVGKRLKEIKQLGNVGIGIFFENAQAFFQPIAPFVGE
ncbi:hypothetical protein LTS18_005740 [Coniosporium uncinatum]|uniref:Uncharacterized protein n=1 Tax=Coniosporium uncinatum TaxID=93489 RepID=A0ACC3D4K4_9PEZI|nr:hypothetical protein LTS18_005740 [Coniosporium uncinatum]